MAFVGLSILVSFCSACHHVTTKAFRVCPPKASLVAYQGYFLSWNTFCLFLAKVSGTTSSFLPVVWVLKAFLHTKHIKARLQMSAGSLHPRCFCIASPHWSNSGEASNSQLKQMCWYVKKLKDSASWPESSASIDAHANTTGMDFVTLRRSATFIHQSHLQFWVWRKIPSIRDFALRPST